MYPILKAGEAELGFTPNQGGQLMLSVSGVQLLVPSAILDLEIDGARVSALTGISTISGPGRLSISGNIGETLQVTLDIVAIGSDAAFEFKLTLGNLGPTPISVTRADALAATMAKGTWQALSYTSKWGDEFQPDPFTVDQPRDLEVRSGRSSLGFSPFLGLEQSGIGGLAVAPVWSGNWHIGVDPQADGTRLIAGIASWKFSHVLAPGANFEAPEVLLAAGTDLNDAVLALTRAVGARLPRSKASEAIPLEWNHWWPYEDKDITEEIFLANAAIATDLGFAVSTLDAGWFGAADAETFWWDIRGDFAEENRARFPGGIGHLAAETRKRGQKFGIWMEIEAVGLKAKVRSERADIMARRDDDPPEAPLDPEDPGFLGYVCLGSSGGQAHVRQLLEDLVGKTGCEWIKVDFNLDPKAGCSCKDHGHGAGDGLYAHYRGLYALLDAFRAAHPEVIVEACASGGLRIDAGLLRHVHCAFLSDPDWTPHHLQVVHGTSMLLPPAAMLHWPMSEWRGKHTNQGLSLRDPTLTDDQFDAIVRSAFMHRFGLSWRLPDLPEKFRTRLKAHLAHYARDIVPLVRNGDLHRLSGTPLRRGGGDPHPAFQLSLDQTHLLLGFSIEPVAEGLAIKPAEGGFVIYPRGLRSSLSYALRDLRADGTSPEIAVRTGAEWMVEGLPAVTGSSFAGMLEPR